MLDERIRSSLKKDYEQLVSFLQNEGYSFDECPTFPSPLNSEGEAMAFAYPIQGILKYHGMADPELRTAYFSSISVNNTVCATITYIKLSRRFDQDQLILNGNVKVSGDREFDRVFHQMGEIRKKTGVKTRALVVSRNLYRSADKEGMAKVVKEKGLGTSASAGAAIATAMISIIFRDYPAFCDNSLMRSIFARYLAGSASRSATGGFSVWLNHPDVGDSGSFSVRLDLHEDQAFISTIDLITIPIVSSLKTERAHQTAPHSPFFERWLTGRNHQIQEFYEALKARNFEKMGECAEADTLNLHAISLTTGVDDYILAWEPETITIMKMVREIRKKQSIPVYYSIDTGPTVVIMTLEQHSHKIVSQLERYLPQLPYYINKVGGVPQTLSLQSPEGQILIEDIKKAEIVQ